ncbi:anhydro-N-acetylmuramic acid kinase [Moheibacter sediminis]|uniref:Anhydro-N-acetylmuramic acid kinase n=1 Tax=Moheibacter sediminis TaxID=1434700 RepID=A0A1W2BBB2_9FLAO|nr:anhydro-N-acetylmuramic acid kinase [Moheibacter sediminis]SMC70101.1 anhydro-N-acetylmuramic acid kinase [Moheibacter sediminis]
MKTFYAIGLMSGTSLDGLDLCYAKFELPSFHFEIIHAETVSYSDEWISRLKNSIYLSGLDLTKLDADYGFYLGQKVNEFIQKYQVKNIDLISSHGHTVFHNPKEKYTLQIGNGAAIFAETGIKTICDFRMQDVALGGQGAPLVPIGDEKLFREFDACLNLGGFSNISFKKENERIAFDVSPFNIILNYLAEKSGFKYDKDGDLARNGTLNNSFLEELNSLEFYRLNPPKSLGIEFCIEEVFPLIEKSNLKTEDLLATFTEHFAQQISKIFNQNQLRDIFITGGGTKNKFFLERLRSMDETEIIIPKDEIIDFKEALVFAFIGILKHENEINVLKSVTGAKKNHSSGVVYS